MNYNGVAITCPTTVTYQRSSEKGAQYFFGQALRGLLKRSGLIKSDIDGLCLSSFTLAPDTGISVADHLGLELSWLEELRLGGASGVISMKRAARAIQNGDADIVACIGAETNNPGSFSDLVSNFSRFSNDAAHPYGAAGPNAVFAMTTRAYMEEYGTTAEDFGRLCLTQRLNSHHNPNALMKDKPLSMQQYLNARTVADPLRLFDCVMPCAGAEAFLVMSTERAHSLELPYSTIASAKELHNPVSDEAVPMSGGWSRFGSQLYQEASYGPSDMNFLQSYDDYPVIVFHQFEDLGFCEKGKASEFVRNTDLSVDSDTLAHNSSGGQLSCGQAGFAGGFLTVTEALRQQQGCTLGKQIKHTDRGVVSGFGMVNYDRGLCSAAAILEKGTH